MQAVTSSSHQAVFSALKIISNNSLSLNVLALTSSGSLFLLEGQITKPDPDSFSHNPCALINGEMHQLEVGSSVICNYLQASCLAVVNMAGGPGIVTVVCDGI